MEVGLRFDLLFLFFPSLFALSNDNAYFCTLETQKDIIMDVDIQTTADGSRTLFVPELDEHYHSVKGALTESQHIFINMGLRASQEPVPRILEIGFGTGLNALLTLQYAEANLRDIRYTSLERYPLPLHIVNEMDYTSLVPYDTAEYFLPLHTSPWNQWAYISPFFRLRKVETDFTTLPLTEEYDLVYFDAFAPEKQPEMWTPQIFEHIYSHLSFRGILVTYCAKGEVRRMLQAAGFSIERLPGPPGGKREILRARKN